MLTIQIFYVVRPNDTVFKIAKRWELPVDSVIAANNLASPYTISVGQQLSIPPGVTKYRVKAADSVYRIAQNYRIQSSLIIEANQLKPPYSLQVGQLLIIPPGVPYYVVQSGDTLEKISRRFNVTTKEKSNYELIQKVNNLSSTTIFPEMKLAIPFAPIGKNGILAYTAGRNGQYDIWLYNPQNDESTQLTNGLGESFSIPIWSPDSSRIAFIGKNAILYVIYVATGSIGAIDQLDEGGDFSLDWSPNSERLAYAARGIITLYNTISHQAESINQPGATDVRWFPNGTDLLFQALDESGTSQLYRYETINDEKMKLTNNTGEPLHHVRLSPDGTFALFTTPGASISIINTVELSTGNVFEVKGGPLSKNYYPEWSPNSSRIAYSATAFDDRGYFSQIRTVGRQGRNDKIWAISNCFQTPVTWSPDGEKLAYLSGCMEQEYASEIWVIDLNHPVPIQLINEINVTSVQWSPTTHMVLSKKQFTSNLFGVTFKYPASWKKVTYERYEGDDGFFQLSAIFGTDNIDEICHDEAFQQLMPYGSSPQIIKLDTPYEESCLILPSADQSDEMMDQAAYIAKYPRPITIGESTYNYFILWADKEHIKGIASTIMFLPLVP